MLLYGGFIRIVANVGITAVAEFETLNYQIMTDLNTSTEATITTETAIGFIPCYRLPFLSLFHADCMEIMKQYPDKYFDLAIVDKINMILLLLCHSIFISLYQLKNI
jgi:hypothetical protein